MENKEEVETQKKRKFWTKKRYWIPGVVLLGFIVTGGYILATHNTNGYNFGVVKEGSLYRSAQPNEAFLEELIARYHIKTIIILRGNVPQFEKEFAERHGVAIHHLPMKASHEPPEENVEEFLRIVMDCRNQPVLIHCRAGVDRTGVLIAVWRIRCDGWSLEKAKQEMKYYWHIPPFVPAAPFEYLNKHYGF